MTDHDNDIPIDVGSPTAHLRKAEENLTHDEEKLVRLRMQKLKTTLSNICKKIKHDELKTEEERRFKIREQERLREKKEKGNKQSDKLKSIRSSQKRQELEKQEKAEQTLELQEKKLIKFKEKIQKESIM